MGNATKVTDALLNTTVTEYDNANRAWRVTSPYVPVCSPTGGMANAQPVTWKEFDRNGNITAVHDANGNTVTNTYDALNGLTLTVDAAGDQVATSYNQV